MTATMHTVTNDFHGTHATFRGTQDANGFVRVSNATYRRIMRKLCGIKDCKCNLHGPYCEPTSGEFDRCDYRIKVS